MFYMCSTNCYFWENKVIIIVVASNYFTFFIWWALVKFYLRPNGPSNIGEFVMYFYGWTLQNLFGVLGNSHCEGSELSTKMSTENPVTINFIYIFRDCIYHFLLSLNPGQPPVSLVSIVVSITKYQFIMEKCSILLTLSVGKSQPLTKQYIFVGVLNKLLNNSLDLRHLNAHVMHKE